MNRLSPKDARKAKQIQALERTIVGTRRSWLHLCHNGRVMIVNQKFGYQLTGEVSLTRGEFEQFQRFYNAAQKVRID